MVYKYLNPKEEMIPPKIPVQRDPAGLYIILLDEPIITPPAKVEFMMSYIIILFP